MDVVSPANYYVAKPFKWDLTSADVLLIDAETKLLSVEIRGLAAIENAIDIRNVISQTKDKIQTAQENVQKLTIAFNSAEAALDQAEIGLLNGGKSKSSAKDSDETEDTKKKKDPQEVLDGAITNLKNARQRLKNAETELNGLELELEGARDNKKSQANDLKPLFSEFVKAKYDADRAKNIHLKAKEIAEAASGNVDPSKDADSDKSKPIHVLPNTEKVVFFTEIGEDGTDNYGEPLQFNAETIWKYALQLLDTDPFMDKKERAKNVLKSMSKASLQKKSTKNAISYQAVVLTAINNNAVEEIDKYQEQHSDYSEKCRLYGIVE